MTVVLDDEKGNRGTVKIVPVAVGLVLLFATVGTAQQVEVTIDFDDLPVGTVVADQYPNTVFSCDPGYEPRVTNETVSNGCSRPNVVSPADIGGDINPWVPLYVDFLVPVNDVKICVADLLTNGGGIIRVFENGGSVTDTFYFCATFSCTLRLIGYHDVTRIEMIPVVLHAKWDDLSFTYVEPSPIPAMSPVGIAALIGMTALFGAGFLWWRRS